MTKELIEEALRWANGHPNRRSGELMRALADALAAVPDAATEQLERAHDLIDLREFEIDNLHELISELRTERDAALAAVERCRALVAEWKHEGPSGPFPDRIAIDVGVEVIEPLLAALDGAPEPETPELFPGTNAALDRLTVRKAAPAEAFCIEHGNFHAVELGDPTCEFEDGFGEPVGGETDGE